MRKNARTCFFFPPNAARRVDAPFSKKTAASVSAASFAPGAAGGHVERRRRSPRFSRSYARRARSRRRSVRVRACTSGGVRAPGSAGMGKNKTKTKKFAEVKRILNPKEARVDKGKQKKKKRDDAPEVKHVCVRVRGQSDRQRRNPLSLAFAPLRRLRRRETTIRPVATLRYASLR
jgi:hypothetical protein